MMKEKIKSVTPLLAVLMLTLALDGCAQSGPYKCYLGSYLGRVMDRETDKPIGGVVIHVTFWSYGSSGAGRIGNQVAVREALTDANGEFVIPADTITHQCFSGRLEGYLQIFKPGYGTRGTPGYRRYCPEQGPEGDCPMETGKYMVWELPKLKTNEERRMNLIQIHRAYNIPDSEQKNLLEAITQERVSIGLSP